MKTAATMPLLQAGYEPATVAAAVTAGDMSLLVHTGRVPVTLYQDGAAPTNGASS